MDTNMVIGFDKIFLKPMSWDILCYLSEHDHLKAAEIGEQMGLSARQVDAAVTKSLVRYGFVIREAKLTRLMKKEYNLICITPVGEKFVKWRKARLEALGEP